MGRKSMKTVLQEVCDVMEENDLAYIEFQHKTYGLIKLSKDHKIDDEDAEDDETVPITELGDIGDFKISDEDFLFSSV